LGIAAVGSDPQYLDGLMQTLARNATRRGHTNVLQHLQGYLKRQIDSEDRQELAEVIDRYRLGRIPLVVPLTLLQHHFRRHPNRYVQDGHFSVVLDGVQHAFHGSRRAPRDRADSSVGPLSLEIEQPLRVLRVRLAANDTGIECDLRFTATTVPTQEPKNVMREDGRLMMDTSRFTQFGKWEGTIVVGGVRREVPALLETGEYVMSRGEVNAARHAGAIPGGGPLVQIGHVTMTGEEDAEAFAAGLNMRMRAA